MASTLPSDPSVDEELVPAAIHERFIAYAVDNVPFAVGFFLTLFFNALRTNFAPGDPGVVRRIIAAWIAVYAAYQFLGNATGATIGKGLFGLRVVRRDNGRKLGAWRSLVRTAVYIAGTPFFNIGFWPALFHPESRALHDLAAGSLVVSVKRKPGSALPYFAAGMGLLLLFVGWGYHATSEMPSYSDLVAIARARDGLLIMGRIEETYKDSAASYTSNLSDLARASGDVEKFKASMSKIFVPQLFQIEAGDSGYRISAVALDRNRTRLTVAGPPPRIVP